MVCIPGLLKDQELTAAVSQAGHRKAGESCEGNWACDEGECLEYRGQQVCMLKCSKRNRAQTLQMFGGELSNSVFQDELGTVSW